MSYILLIPLLIFAVHGGFSFAHPSWNSDLGAREGKIAITTSGSEGLRDSLQSWIAVLLCVSAMLPYCRRVLDVCLQMPLMSLLPL
ncbi:hypothetical protein ACPOL_5681 [Acidisarcina polymorpha]|uniref:Uncharacterized protein n=1 Tax=Acidisarcina polymorpha TaxID=2211140 RepID=A0A2Z5G7Y6_9BACT|nr:hypothetical protein ACPOL_5681 [Acidisarcina polymorpha]